MTAMNLSGRRRVIRRPVDPVRSIEAVDSEETMLMSDGATLHIPRGFTASGIKAGLKASGTLDMAVLAADRPCAAAGTFTTNRVCAAPVKWCRELLPADDIQAIVINSGNANAATGELGSGERPAHRGVPRLNIWAVDPSKSWSHRRASSATSSPWIRSRQGSPRPSPVSRPSPQAFQTAAASIMTTDTHPKIVSQRQMIAGREVTLVGIAKGAAMIGPRMATMLGFLLTDAPLWANELHDILADAVEHSFNCLSVEGHASTNDTVLLLSSTATTDPILQGDDVGAFAAMVRSTCETLARAIADDGEGATHFITIDVEGCETFEDARSIARAVADSPLVKTAIHGADPNWGRIVSAAGYSGVDFVEEELSLWINDVSPSTRTACRFPLTPPACRSQSSPNETSTCGWP